MARGGAEPSLIPRCPRCWQPSRRAIRFSAGDYAELLGLYLGDGCISPAQRVWRLRVALDPAYPGIIDNVRGLLRRSFPENSVGLVRERNSTVMVSLYSSHLTCLFPQHGTGKKHERPILLEGWQRGHLEDAPWAFLRGCIQSDGCSFINRTGPYRYLTFDFCNRSEDIRSLFVYACDLVGVRYRKHGIRVRINRRSSVARMEAEVGVKR